MRKKHNNLFKHTFVGLFIIVYLGLPMLWPADEASGEKYRQWLELVEYVITRDELTTFNRLSNDRDRDVFMSLFWNLRDPSPGTGENEFKTEHLRRFQYANRYFGYGTPRPGWKTDMGRIYIILGEPSSKSRYEMDNVVVPSEIWSYYGLNRPGLPANFWVVFWKEHGIGEYRIYDPATNGPHSLLRKSRNTVDLNPLDIEACYQTIAGEYPTLARASLSLIPNEVTLDFSSSMRSQQLLGKIMALPREKINDTYATNFLKYKGKVDVDYSINFIEAKHHSMILRDPETGLNFLHFALRPDKVSALSQEEGADYHFDFQLNVALHRGDVPIFEYRKHFPFSGDHDEVLRHFSNSLMISDLFPVPPGDYRVSVLLQNRINKEFTYFDKKISVPDSTPTGPVISALMPVREVKRTGRRAFVPFKFRDLEVTPVPRREFGQEDRVTILFHLDRGGEGTHYTGALAGEITVSDFFEAEKYQRKYPVAIAAGDKKETFTHELDAMSPGYYRVELRLAGAGGAPVLQKTGDFTVSVKRQVAGTTHLFKAAPHTNKFLYYHILGLQYMRLDNLGRAEEYLALAFALRPGYVKLIKDYCGLLLKLKKNRKVLEITESLKDTEKYRFDYHGLRGKALFQAGRYPEAATSLAEANRIYDSDVSVLNALGLSYLKTGERERAREVFSASLRLDGDQKEIARILEELK